MDRGNKRRWAEVVKATRKCPRCRPHGGCNKTMHRPRPDRHKDHHK